MITQDLLDLVLVEAPAWKPSQDQENLMNSLIGQLRELNSDVAEQAAEYTAHMQGRWTPGREGTASRWIDRMINKVRELRQEQRVARPSVGIEDGMYLLDDTVYKVQHAVHGSGNQYAKRLVPNEPGQKAQFVYAPGVVRQLRPKHRMTKEQAKQWGALYGTCVRCGAVLTAEDSIDRMMGPVCATKI